MLTTALKQELINRRGKKCERCGLTEWLGEPIKLEVHHIDGNRQNDNEINLQVLCPNCHSLTPNHSKNMNHHSISDAELLKYLQEAPNINQALLNAGLSTAGANYKRARELICEYKLVHLYDKSSLYLKPVEQTVTRCVNCGAIITDGATRCLKCKALNERVVERPPREELKELIRTTPFTTIGQRFGVTDNTIKKWCQRYNLPYRKKDIKLYTNEEWQNL